MTQRLLRLLCGLLFVLFFALPYGFAQQRSPYKNLRTAANVAVYDTIAGVNLDVNESTPQPKHGNLNVTVIVPGGSGNPYIFKVEYVPDPGFIGVDTFVLEHRYLSSYPFLVYRGYRVSVMPSLVKAKVDYATTHTSTPVAINVLANDSGAWGPLSVTALPLVNNGTATINGNNEVVFTPKPGFLGVAQVNYVVCDALLTCQTASIHIGVHNGLPSTEQLQVFTTKNQSLDIPLTFDGYTLFQSPTNGVVTLFGGKGFRYLPATGYSGTDNFVLKTVVNGAPFLKQVTVKVLDNPVANQMAMDDLRFTAKDQPITFNVRSNDIGNLLVKSWATPNNFPGTLTGKNGVGNVTFTPNPGFSGVATFSYRLGNASVAALETGTVTIVVDNIAPPAVFPYQLTTPKETPLVLRYDLPYANYNFSVLEAPEHGDLEYIAGASSQMIDGQSVVGKNLLIFKPEYGYTGGADFSLEFCAPNGECGTTRIDLEVIDPNDAATSSCISDCTWPGDVNMDGLINNKDLLPLGYVMGLDGTARINGSMDWVAQHSTNWNYPFHVLPNDLKYVDADGNGQLNAEDLQTIQEHYSQAHNLVPKTVITGKGLPFSLELLTPNPQFGDLIKIKVSLGSESLPAFDIYGFTFDMTLSNGVVDSAFTMTFLDNSWLNLNSPSINLAKRPFQGRFETAFSRTNGHSVSGFGSIGTLEFVIIEVIDIGGQNGRQTLTLNPTIMSADGSSSSGEPITLEIPIKPKDRSASKARDNSQGLSVFPSPAHDVLNVSWEGIGQVETLKLSDTHGKMLQERRDFTGAQTQLNVSELPSGMYILSARTANGVISKKVQVLR
jgi:hypothetical protein